MRFEITSMIEENEVDLMVLSSQNASQYGIIDINGKKIGLSWATINPPEVQEFEDFQIITIGYGTIFIIISILDFEVLMKFRLDYDLVVIEKYDYRLFVVTELNILCINLNNKSIFKVIDLPEIADNIELRNDELIISCIDGNVITRKL